ncbi:TonB-dependent receptor domain-containing protein [Thalassovita sp.]|uniref:TonB-dependent receptor domain-containing protein n=1 Tax=Thalassovita sp. TaxID=1979401 RepID=UPI002AAF27EB|nr:TonB-dependent receptor [Thalassovita sp.]
MNRSVRGALLCAALSSVASAVWAEDVFELNTIYIGTYELGTELNDVDVSGEDLARTKPTDLQDVFKGEPTVAVGSSIPTSQKIYVNGVEETNLVVTIDGSRQNNKVFHHAATNIIDPALLKAVKVNPGVATADQGPGAIGGALEFQTKDVADLLAEGDDFGGFTALEFNSNGNTITTGNAVYGRKGAIEYLGYLKFADGEEFEDGSGTEVVGSGVHLWSGLAKVAFDTPDAGRVELSYERLIDDNPRPFRANMGGLLAGRPVPATQIYDLDRQNIVLSYSDDRSGAAWNPEILLAYSSTKLTTDNEGDWTDGKTQSLNGKIQNTFELSMGDIVAGLDFYSDKSSMEYAGADGAYRAEKVTNVGAFAQAYIDVTDTFLLSTGLRADHQKFTGVDGAEFENSGVSANISGELEVSSNLTLSAGYSSVWGGLTLSESFLMNADWEYPDSPEEVTSENLYLAGELALGDWTLNAKLFKTEISDARAPMWAPPSGSAIPMSEMPFNNTDMTSEGFELGVGYDWGVGFINVGYANIDTTLNGTAADSYTGNYLTAPLGEMITIEAGHTFQNLGLTVGADAQIGLKDTAYVDVAGAGAGAQEIPSYEVVNVFAEYNPSRMENLTVRAEINNLFDEHYAARGTYGQEFAVVVPVYEPGRSVKVMATLNF